MRGRWDKSSAPQNNTNHIPFLASESKAFSTMKMTITLLLLATVLVSGVIADPPLASSGGQMNPIHAMKQGSDCMRQALECMKTPLGPVGSVAVKISDSFGAVTDQAVKTLNIQTR